MSDFGEGYAQLKGKEYYHENEMFPTVGDFVLIGYNKVERFRYIAETPEKTDRLSLFDMMT